MLPVDNVYDMLFNTKGLEVHYYLFYFIEFIEALLAFDVPLWNTISSNDSL